MMKQMTKTLETRIKSWIYSQLSIFENHKNSFYLQEKLEQLRMNSVQN